jgi:hypothetical protein
MDEIERIKKLYQEGAISREEFFLLVEKIVLKSDDLTTKDKNDESLPKKEQSDPTQQQVHSVDSTIIADTSQKQPENMTKYRFPDKIAQAGAKLKLSAVCQVWSRILAAITIILFMYNSGKILTDLMTVTYNFNDITGPIMLISLFGLASFISWIFSVVALYKAGKSLEDSH